MSTYLNISVPRFRTTGRLVQWVRRNRPSVRLPAESERCFFSSKEPASKVCFNLLSYANMVGPLDRELEAVIPDEEIHKYIAKVAQRGVKVEESLLDRVHDQAKLANLASVVGRLPERLEARITEPASVLSYAKTVRPLPESMELCLVESHHYVAKYLEVLHYQSLPMPERLLRALVGHDQYFLDLASRMGRLPDYLLDSIKTPRVALLYAIRQKERLPSHLEDVLAGDMDCALKYAFEVIRANASPRLPDNLHAMVMLSASGEHNVRHYLSEVERTSKEPA